VFKIPSVVIFNEQWPASRVVQCGSKCAARPQVNSIRAWLSNSTGMISSSSWRAVRTAGARGAMFSAGRPSRSPACGLAPHERPSPTLRPGFRRHPEGGPRTATWPWAGRRNARPRRIFPPFDRPWPQSPGGYARADGWRSIQDLTIPSGPFDGVEWASRNGTFAGLVVRRQSVKATSVDGVPTALSARRRSPQSTLQPPLRECRGLRPDPGPDRGPAPSSSGGAAPVIPRPRPGAWAQGRPRRPRCRPRTAPRS
jgi:hypothetical protein